VTEGSISSGATGARHGPPDGARPYPIDGLDLYAIDEGPPDPIRTVVLLHGTPGSVADWTPVRIHLRDRYRVVTVERPGMGWSASPVTAGEYSLGRHAARIHRLLARLRIEAPILVGWSYGGGIALRIAADQPQDVAGIVHLCGVGPGLVEGFRHRSRVYAVRVGALLEAPVMGALLARWVVPAALGALDPARLLRAQFGSDWPLVPPDWIDGRMRVLRRPNVIRNSRREVVNLPADLAALRPLLPTIRRPMRIVTSELDHLIPAGVGDELVRVLPDAVQIRVAGAGHGFHIVRPERLAAVVDELAAAIG
jgi:pimeloyl-ACP methyl ester carboxylesterase